jgi:hypothetical protein
MAEGENAALPDFQATLLQSPPDSPAGLASLHKLRTERRQTLWLFQADKRAVKSTIRRLGEELGQRLLGHFAGEER